MTPDLPTPDPPTLTETEPPAESGTSADGDASEEYRRDELETLLEDGAWAEGFETWTAETSLTASEVALLRRHDVFDQLDFYWNPADEGVAYRVPQFSDDLREALATDRDAQELASELESLGGVVSSRLAADYPSRDEPAAGGA
jgi:hypothetical protein